MNSTNGSVNPNGAQHVQATGPHHSAAINGHDTRQVDEAPVLDGTLDENDIKITIGLELHGRSTELVNLTLDRVVFEAAEGRNRWQLLQGVQNTINELRRATAYKLKKKGINEDTPSASEASDFPDELRIHEPPPVNGSSL